MAKYGAPIMVDEIRGKIGGIVFSNARSGPTIRVRVTPSNPVSAAQSAVRAALVKAARGFKSLSTTNAQAWRTYGFGVVIPNGVGGNFQASGINAYVQLAARFLAIAPGGTPPATPPATPFVADAVTFTGGGAVGDITLTASGANDANVYTEVLVAALPSPNRIPKPGDYRTQEYHHFVGGALTRTYTKPVGYYSIAIREVLSTTGEASPIVTVGTFQST